MGSKKVTLGIPCYNEEDILSETLDSVEELDYNLDRILVLDDGSDDETASIASAHPQVELLQHKSNRGRGTARNTILSATDTPLLAMIDADIRPRERWLSTLVETMDATGASAVGGMVVEKGEDPADKWRQIRLGVNEFDKEGKVSHVAGGNVLFQTETIREVGGWPDLQSTEDQEVCHRLNEEGYTIYYTPEAVVEHVGEDTPQSVLRNLWRWHFEGRNEPISKFEIIPRLAHHTAKGALYCVEDVIAGRWWAIPISARLPVTFLREDLKRID